MLRKEGQRQRRQQNRNWREEAANTTWPVKGILWKTDGWNYQYLSKFSSYSCEMILFNRQTFTSGLILLFLFFPPTCENVHPWKGGDQWFVYSVAAEWRCHALTRGIPRSEGWRAACRAAPPPTHLLHLLGAGWKLAVELRCRQKRHRNIIITTVQMLQSRSGGASENTSVRWANDRRGAEDRWNYGGFKGDRGPEVQTCSRE